MLSNNYKKNYNKPDYPYTKLSRGNIKNICKNCLNINNNIVIIENCNPPISPDINEICFSDCKYNIPDKCCK